MENTTIEHPWSYNAAVNQPLVLVCFGQKISIKAPYSPEKESQKCVTAALTATLI